MSNKRKTKERLQSKGPLNVLDYLQLLLSTTAYPSGEEFLLTPVFLSDLSRPIIAFTTVANDISSSRFVVQRVDVSVSGDIIRELKIMTRDSVKLFRRFSRVKLNQTDYFTAIASVDGLRKVRLLKKLLSVTVDHTSLSNVAGKFVSTGLCETPFFGLLRISYVKNQYHIAMNAAKATTELVSLLLSAVLAVYDQDDKKGDRKEITTQYVFDLLSRAYDILT